MKRSLAVAIITLAATFAAPVFAGAREDLLAQYAAASKSGGFSAARGQTLHTKDFAGGKPNMPACTSCHGKDSRGPGRTTAGKTIDAMAVSVTPSRYTDPAKVEKWFKRNCNDVLGRDCTAQEKGDWLTYMIGQ